MAEATSAPVDMSGEWQLVRNENFDEFLKAAGIGMIKRKVLNSASPVMEIHQDGDEFNVTVKLAVVSKVSTFKAGEEQTQNNPVWLDKERRVLAEWQGSKLVQRVVSAPEGTPVMSIEREIVDGEIVLTMRRGEVVAKRYFKKL